MSQPLPLSPPAAAPWTPERIALLKRLWAEGRSAGQIAEALGGGASRSSVAGKIHRLGIGRPPAVMRAAVPPAGRRLVSSFSKTGLSPPRQIRASGTDISPGQAALLALEPHQCRWPIGDPQVEGFRFCGGFAETDSAPYCAMHRRLSRSPVAAPPVEDLLRDLRRHLG